MICRAVTWPSTLQCVEFSALLIGVVYAFSAKYLVLVQFMRFSKSLSSGFSPHAGLILTPSSATCILSLHRLDCLPFLFWCCCFTSVKRIKVPHIHKMCFSYILVTDRPWSCRNGPVRCCIVKPWSQLHFLIFDWRCVDRSNWFIYFPFVAWVIKFWF